MNWANGKLVGFDLETTGVDPMTARPVQFAFPRYDFCALLEGQGRHGLINPEMLIPPETTKIHGITDEMVQERGGDFRRSIIGIANEIVHAGELGIPLIGMNCRFDLTIIDQRLRELENEGLRDRGWNGVVIDVHVIDKYVDRYRKGSRNLKTLCEVYGVQHNNAHSAMGDAVAAMDIAITIATNYPEIGEMPLDVLHVSQVAWRREQIRNFSEYRVKKGEAALPEEEGNWPLVTDALVVIP